MEDHRDLDDDEDEEDNLFDEDMEALRRACMITGTNPADLSSSAAAAGESVSEEEKLGLDGGEEEEDDDDYDLELVQNIRNRFSVAAEEVEPLVLKPLCTLPPGMVFSGDDEADDDDFETLRAIQRRFAAYGNDALKNSPENCLQKKEHVVGSSISLERKASIHRVDACNEFLDREHASQLADQSGDNLMEQPPAIEWNPIDSSNPSTSQSTNFPKSAKVFMDAIKKNRSFQKFLRSKLIQIEAKIEENKKLKERVKILRDFQVTCKKRTGRALSQKKDTRVQLISMKKVCPSKDAKVHDKKISAMCYGPLENSHVANYRMALEKFPLSLDNKRWSELEKKNLEKGIQQQFQEMVLQNLVDRMSDSGNSGEGVDDLDNILASVKNLNITPEQTREFLPKVNWDQVASMYVVGRSGAECETRWLNFEDPLINHNPWTAQEDKNLLFFVQNKGISNWFDISVSLGTNRTPFQCLARYQRSLNVSILKREWSKDDDAKLRSAVEVFGEHNWQAVASSLEGWTGTQCSNRWKKSLHPAREKVGRWTEDEDKRLTVAQMLFGPRNWKKTAQFVPGRTEVQCRERWVNSLDPSLNWDKWTQEEDSKLRAAIAEHGHCWAKVAAALPRRTDNMCRRRWKRLLPHEVPVLQAARRLQKAALICNFVDRESERPAIGPNDFCPLAAITAGEDVNHSEKQANKLREPRPKKKKIESGCKTAKNRKPKKSKEHTQNVSEQALVLTNHDELLTCDRQEATTNQGSENSTVTIEGKNHSLSPHMEMQLRAETGEVSPGPDCKTKKRRRKPCSKGTELVEHGEDRQCPELQSASLNSSTIDGIEPLVESNTMLAKKRRVPLKRKDSSNINASYGIDPLDESNTTLARKRLVSSKQKDFGSISPSHGIEPLDESNTTLAKKRRVSSKQKDSGNTSTSAGIEPLDESITTLAKKRRLSSKRKNKSTTNGIEPHVDSNTAPAKKRRVISKRKDGMNVCTTITEEHQNIDALSGKSLPTGSTTEAKHHEALSCMDSTQAMEISSERIGPLGKERKVSKRSTNTKGSRWRRKGNDLVGIPPEVARLNKAKPSNESCMVQSLGESDGVSNGSKERLLDNHGNECSIELQLVPVQVVADDVEKLVLNDGESNVVACNDEPGRASLSGEPAISLEESMKDISTNHASVALFQATNRQNFECGLQAHRPSSSIRGSQLLSKRVNQLQDGNNVSVVAGGPGGPGVVVSEAAPERVEKEPREDDNPVVDDDMTLACFLGNRSKKRPLRSSIE